MIFKESCVEARCKQKLGETQISKPRNKILEKSIERNGGGAVRSSGRFVLCAVFDGGVIPFCNLSGVRSLESVSPSPQFRTFFKTTIVIFHNVFFSINAYILSYRFLFQFINKLPL